MKKFRIIITMIAVMLAFSISASAFGLFKNADLLPSMDHTKTPIESDVSNERQTIGNTITYHGEKYRYNSNITNILFMVIDKYEPFESSYEPGDAGESDVLILLSMDKDTKEGKILEIPSDTMIQLDRYDKFGNIDGSEAGPIKLQYAYGIGGSQSCWASKKTVSKLLNDLEIDSYLTLSTAGIIDIVDELGLTYYNDTQEFSSDLMIDLTDRLFEIDTVKLIPLLLKSLGSYILTDMSADELKDLSDYHFNQEDILTLPGEDVQTETKTGYYIDEETLQKLIIDNYYNKI